MNINFDQQFFANPSWDSFVILFFLAGGLLYSFFASRERLLVVLLSIYSSLAISLNTPALLQLVSTFDQETFVKYRVGFFLGVFLLLYILLSHRLTLQSDIGRSWLHAILLSFLQIGLLISSVLLFIPHTMYQSVMAETFFTGNIQRTIWMLAPVAGLFLMKGTKE
ncbi:MAG: hypothetical protein Q7R79_01470 [bacterium]|nr:hypothetical protein [bacterium]